MVEDYWIPFQLEAKKQPVMMALPGAHFQQQIFLRCTEQH